MKIRSLFLCMCLVIVCSFCTKKSQKPDILPIVPDGAQAVSLKGEPLYPATPPDSAMAKLEEAKNTFAAEADLAREFSE